MQRCQANTYALIKISVWKRAFAVGISPIFFYDIWYKVKIIYQIF